MNIEHLMSRRRLIAFLVFSGCASTGMLSVALSIVVLRPPLVCLVPDLSESSVVRAGKVPDASARAFAMLYVMFRKNPGYGRGSFGTSPGVGGALLLGKGGSRPSEAKQVGT